MSQVENKADEHELAGTGYELFMAALSVLSLVNLVLLEVMHDDNTLNVVHVIDIVLSVAFLLDFAVRFKRAPSRSTYFWRNFGWADLLASMPFPQAKVLRIFRLVRVVRLLRRHGARYIWRTVVRDRAENSLLSLILMAVLVLEFGSLEMIVLERSSPTANIHTASDAIWYTIVTISTVGYGDKYPTTNDGRALGALIIVLGVGIFGTLTGYLANVFLGPRRSAAKEPAE